LKLETRNYFFIGYGIKAARRNPPRGRKEMIQRVVGTPQISAKSPSRAAPSPPIPKERPRMRPEASPTFRGMKDWPMAMETEKEKMRISPARVSQMKAQTPELRINRTKSGQLVPRLKRMVFL
jgi:hypothetical protein